jgi:hypothetical protein
MAWTHLIYEAYCMYRCSKDKYVKTHELLDDGTFSKESIKFKNPAYVDGKRPKWCFVKKDMTPVSMCQLDNCPFLGLVAVEGKEYDAMIKAWFDAQSDGIDRS